MSTVDSGDELATEAVPVVPLPAKGGASSAVPGLRRATLGNGLSVFLVERAGAPLVTARLIFPRGSSSAPQGKSGIAELTAQLLRRGTEKHTAEEVNDLLEGAGTDLGVWVNDDSTRFSVTAEPKTAAPLMALLSELVREGSFPKREVSSLRDRTCAQIQGSLDDAEWVATRAVYRAIFPGHPYGVPSEGWSKEVAGLHRRDARAFAEEFTARGACLVLSGAVAGARAEPWQRPFTQLPAGPEAPPPLPPPPAIVGRQVLIIDKPDASQAQVRIVGPGFRRDLPDLVAAVLGNGVLGDGFSSRLVNEVRVNRGLTYGISSRFGALAVGGLFMVRSFTRLEKVVELVEVILDQMKLLRDEGFAEDELARVRTYLGGSFRLSTETADQVGNQVADAFRFGLGEDWVVRYPRLLDETPREAILAALQAHLPLENLRVVAVGPATTLEPQLKRLGPVEVLPLKAVA